MTRLNDRTLRLVDIEMDEVDGIVRLAAKEMQYVVAVLTGHDGVGQRRLVCDADGQLGTVEASAAESILYLIDMQSDLNLAAGFLQTVATDTGLIDTDVGSMKDTLSARMPVLVDWSTFSQCTWPGEFWFTSVRSQGEHSWLGDLLAAGLYHGEWAGDPDFEWTLTGLADILYDVWDQVNHCITTKNYT